MTGILVINEFLYSTKFNEIHSWLLEAATKKNISMILRTNAELLIDLSLKKKEKTADFILFWDKDVKLAYYLEELGYRVFNSSKAIEICDDKSLTHLHLMNSGILTPKTIIAPMTFANIGYTNYNFLQKVEESLGFPMIIKESFGSFGQQVYLVKNREELIQRVKSIGASPMLFQEFIQSSFGRDIRLQVIGKEVVAAMYRYSTQEDFRANLTIGGRMENYQPSNKECEIAIKSCELLGLDFAGVDLLFGEDEQPILCEINSNAHFKNIYDCTGVNTAQMIIEYIMKKLDQ